MNSKGLTLVELLITMFILSVVLMLTSSYFVSSQELRRNTEARTEAQDKARLLMQAVSQDIELIGSSRYVTVSGTSTTVNSTTAVLPNGWVACAASPCVAPVGTDKGLTAQDSIRGRYISSLQTLSDACRSFAYRFDGSNVQRSDVKCGSDDNFVALADNVLALELRYQCSDGAESATPVCGGQRFLRSVQVHLIVASDRSTPNPTTTQFTLPDGSKLDCPAQRFCFSMAQEVLMPNLKGLG
jgi:prepilin-type N-terminal cleavage/methylation domain-containing protein